MNAKTPIVGTLGRNPIAMLAASAGVVASMQLSSDNREPLEAAGMLGQVFQTDGGEVRMVEAAAGDGSGSKIPTFDMVAYRGGKIRQWFSRYPMVVDLAGLEIPDRDIPIRLQHSSSQGVGHATSATLVKAGDRTELHANGVISRSTEAARDVIESGKNGFPWQASMGAEIYSVEEVLKGSVVVNGQTHQAPVNVIRKSRLTELSFVDLGADDTTTTRVAAEADQGGQQPPNQATPPANAQADPPQNLNANAQGGAPGNGGTLETLAAMRQRAERNAQREREITAAAQEAFESRPDLSDYIFQASESAIRGGIDPKDFRLEMMRLGRDHGGDFTGPRRDNSVGSAVIEAALCMSGGMDDTALQASFDDKTLESASSRWRGTMGLDLAISLAARAGGWTGDSVKADIEGAMRAAFPSGSHRVQASSMSTVSLPNMLSNVANKFLRQGFDSVEDAYAKFTDFGTVRDFKEKTTLTLTGDYTFKRVGRSGELEHGEPGEEVYTNQADTFGRILGITRQDIINDNLDALTAVPRKIGRGGKLAFLTDFWGIFQDNTSFFTAGRGNKLTGAGSALDLAALTAAITALVTQTDPDGNPLGLSGNDLILLCHPSLYPTAYQLANSTEIRDPGASSAFGTANPHAKMFTPVMSQYITTATHWYLMVKPSVLPVIESVFLNGKRAPTVESANANFDTLGVQMRGWWDFGNSLQEYRAGVFNVGA